MSITGAKAISQFLKSKLSRPPASRGQSFLIAFPNLGMRIQAAPETKWDGWNIRNLSFGNGPLNMAGFDLDAWLFAQNRGTESQATRVHDEDDLSDRHVIFWERLLYKDEHEKMALLATSHIMAKFPQYDLVSDDGIDLAVKDMTEHLASFHPVLMEEDGRRL
ncbi:hypothetical protein FISHEDRAFT_70464 [Fistulina hepatica ATCC 64428]|uniref:Uncharacterized protein n=1 Tax=Fistulina hepatica ATCC 64428 TaxID=1128425 RepID=A0A0D7AKB0_9AGAR|nr:hypothetical protein FISHEDRAFT_70464 [Fistulina hepatica ATCC 64428]